MIEKPKIFSNLRKWREQNNLTSTEWKYYVEISAKQRALLCTLYLILGAIAGFWVIYAH